MFSRWLPERPGISALPDYGYYELHTACPDSASTKLRPGMETRKTKEFKCASNDLNVTYSYKLHKGHFKSNPSILKMEMGGKRHALAVLPPAPLVQKGAWAS